MKFRQEALALQAQRDHVANMLKNMKSELKKSTLKEPVKGKQAEPSLKTGEDRK